MASEIVIHTCWYTVAGHQDSIRGIAVGKSQCAQTSPELAESQGIGGSTNYICNH